MNKLFINAAFHLIINEKESAKGILIDGSKIVDIYFGDIPHMHDCEIIDLGGNHVYPGFIDSHTHSFEGGLYSQSLDLSVATSHKQVLDLVNEYYLHGKSNGVEQLDAFRFDENKTEMKRFPSRHELDKVCPDIPLVLRRIDGHSSVINSIAWKKFWAANKDISNNSRILTHSENNILKGALNDKVVHWFHSNSSEQTILNAYKQASNIAVANGITTVHTMVGDSLNSIMHYHFLRDNLSQFDVEFILYPQSFNLRATLDAGAKRIGGCILADGSLGSYTAALRQPYHNKPDEYGLLYHDNQFWQEFITSAHKHDLQVAVHCIGDRAIKQINDIYLKLSRSSDSVLRHQLIHCELTQNDLIKEIAQSKAIPVMQPSFDLYWGGEGGFYEKVLGNQRKNNMNRYKTLIDNGIKITGGSDWYITELDALQGIKAAVNHNNPLERINLNEALKMYTVNAAILSHDENRLGILQKGFNADFVCLDKEIPSDNTMDDSQVIATYKSGQQVYRK